MSEEQTKIVRARRYAGVVLREFGAYAAWLTAGDWRATRNRAERLEPAPYGSGYRCDWQWTSDLHAPKIIPALGRRLMRRALTDHPVQRVEASSRSTGATPQVTFLIGHRGMARLPHLLATLQSIAAQQGPAVECIVVEQDTVSQLGPHLPPWVRLVHTPPPAPDMPYCRSWTFNVGAGLARGDVLVLHDNDMLVPVDYAASVLDRVRRGYDAVNLKRFIFYLTQAHTQAVFDGRADLLDAAPEVIVQNLEGGGSVAITRAGYARIGGLDESFIGWGGEDNEFWERVQTLRVWPWASLPLVHLWHAAQPGKQDAQYHTATQFSALTQVDRHERIRRLAGAPKGRMEGPTGRSTVSLNNNNDSEL